MNIEGSFQHILTDLVAFAVTGDRRRRDPRRPASTAPTRSRRSSSPRSCSTRPSGCSATRAACCSRSRRADLDVDEVGRAMASHPHVTEVHDLHVWEIGSGFAALSAHVLVEPDADCHGAPPRARGDARTSASGSTTRRSRSTTRASSTYSRSAAPRRAEPDSPRSGDRTLVLVGFHHLARSVLETVLHDCQVTRRITSVITRPIIGSPIRAPSETTIALATTPSETKPSTRAWLPSAIMRRAREALAGAEAYLGGDLVADKADHSGGGQHPQVREVLRVDEALDRLVERHAALRRRSPARRRARRASRRGTSGGRTRSRAGSRSGRRRSCGSGRRGARPNLTATKIATCAPAASPRTARLIETALTPSCERTIERSTSPCEWPCSSP